MELGRENEALKALVGNKKSELLEMLRGEAGNELQNLTSKERLDTLIRTLANPQPHFFNALLEAELFNSKIVQIRVIFNNDKMK